MSIDRILKSRLLEEEEVVSDIPTITEDNESLSSTSVGVMKAYQNANKWLDTLKEELLIEHSCVFFSDYVHNLAHTMPVRFDKFGDILHTANIKVPYPATEYISEVPEDVESIINMVLDILSEISESLRTFIKATQDTEHHSMACAAEELLVDIDKEFTPLYRIQGAYSRCNGDILGFDKWVNHFVQGQSRLLG